MPLPEKKIALSRLTARERVYRSLRDWITDGTLRPGEQLYDAEIAKFFSVSRTPVREALQMLSLGGFVEIVPGKESRVTLIDEDEVRQAYDMLAILHCAALELAFPQVTPELIGQLRGINAESARAFQLRNAEKIRENDKKFHRVLLDLAGNRYLTECAESLLPHVLRVENLHFKYFIEHVDSVNEHSRIVDALEKRDLPAAREEMRRNWQHFGLDIDQI